MRFLLTIVLCLAYIHCPYFTPMSTFSTIIFIVIGVFSSITALLEDIVNIFG